MRPAAAILMCLTLLPVPFAVAAEDGTGGGSPVSVSVRLTPPSQPYIRSASLVVEARADAKATVAVSEFKAEVDGVETSALPQESVEEEGTGKKLHRREFRIDPIKPGMYRLADLELTVALDGNEEKIILPGQLYAAGELTEEEQAALGAFAEAAAPSAFTEHRMPPFWLLVLSLAGAVLVAAAVFYALRRKKAPVAAPPRPAWEVAFQRLRELKMRNLPMNGRSEAYYVDLTAILRYYLEDRFGLNAPEQTTQEFLEAASSGALVSPDQQEFLAAFLRHSDRVKFARLEPSIQEMEERFDEVERFVWETVPSAGDENGETVA